MATPGLELLFALASPDITKPQDALVCFIHWELVTRGLLCLGKSEQVGADVKGSERLPDGWSANKALYTLLYGKGNSQILLKALPVEDALIINAVELKTEKVSEVTLNVNDFIDRKNLHQFHSVYKKSVDLMKRIQEGLISPLLGRKETPKPEKEHKRPSAHDPHDPLRIPPRAPPPSKPSWTEPPGSLPYGSADLDPMGGSSGGMIMDPFNTGRTRPRPDPLAGLPPGAVPPGARFDPFSPLGSGRAEPDPDHLPPPGYDDMFM